MASRRGASTATGWRTIDFGEREWLSAIEPLPGGRLLVAGTRVPGRTLPSDAVVLAMLEADGSLRFRFGNRGRAILRATTGRESPQATDLFLDGDRAIVVGEAGGDFLAARTASRPEPDPAPLTACTRRRVSLRPGRLPKTRRG